MAKRKFVFIAEGDVFLRIVFDEDQHPLTEAWSAGLKSNPVIIEIPIDSPVKNGWTWDGNNFIPPQ